MIADFVIINSSNMKSVLIATVTVILTFTSWISISLTNTALVLSRGAAKIQREVGDDTRLTENRNARSVQLTDWEWLPGELLSGSEGLAGLDMKISARLVKH